MDLSNHLSSIIYNIGRKCIRISIKQPSSDAFRPTNIWKIYVSLSGNAYWASGPKCVNGLTDANVNFQNYSINNRFLDIWIIVWRYFGWIQGMKGKVYK